MAREGCEEVYALVGRKKAGDEADARGDLLMPGAAASAGAGTASFSVCICVATPGPVLDAAVAARFSSSVYSSDSSISAMRRRSISSATSRSEASSSFTSV